MTLLRSCIATAACLITTGSVRAQQSDGLEFLRPSNHAYVEVKGVVQSGVDGAPVSQAHVVVSWHGATYDGLRGDTNYRCLLIAGGATDTQGRFSIQAPLDKIYRSGLAQQGVDVRAYKPGSEEHASASEEHGREYKIDKETMISPRAWRHAGVVDAWRVTLRARMYPAAPDAQDRLLWLRELTSLPSGCENRAGLGAIRQFLSDASGEARSIAKTRYEQRLAGIMALRAQRPLDGDLADAERVILGEAPAVTVVEKSSDGTTRIQHQYPPGYDDLERRDIQDQTRLMQAAETGNVAEVRRLLDLGANPNRTRRGVRGAPADDSALTLAITRYFPVGSDREKYVLIIAALLSHPSINPDVRGHPFGYTPLMTALDLGEADVVEMLLNAGADPSLWADGGTRNALGVAIGKMRQRNLDGSHPVNLERQFAALLASKRLDLNAPGAGEGDTALTAAARNGDTKIVRQLLEAGADPNAPNVKKQTPLMEIRRAAALNPRRPQFAETLRLIASWPGAKE